MQDRSGGKNEEIEKVFIGDHFPMRYELIEYRMPKLKSSQI